ncbi:MAG: HIT domain-containing protein [Candidatus Limnocylindria bacterium]
MADCIFCRIVSGDAPAEIVHQDDLVVAFKDIQPLAPFHVLVVSRRHIATIADTDDESLAGRLVVVATALARDAGYAERGFRLAANAGPDAGMGVPHLHFHALAGRPLGPPAAR